MSRGKTRFFLRFAALLAAAVCLSPAAGDRAAADPPRYIFFFLADGAGLSHLEITRQYDAATGKRGFHAIDEILRQGSLGLLTTGTADNLVTDSAAAATALASGCKAKNRVIGICADGATRKTALELAKERGMRIGMITNAAVYDASPAAFAARVADRRNISSIIDQYLKLEPDVLMGGGREAFLARDLVGSFKNRGYAYVSDSQGLARLTRGKALGLFAPDEMSFDLDRDPKTEPTLAQMTQAALKLFADADGFALFIENENVDSAAHLADAASVIHAMKDLDQAVAVAYEFFRKHQRETLVIVTADHETGGLNLTSGATRDGLGKIGVIRISIKKAIDQLGRRPTRRRLRDLVAANFPGFTLTREVENAVVEKKGAAAALGLMVANHTQLRWATTGHTNQPVFIGAIGAGSERFRGYQYNTDVGRHLADLLTSKKANN